MALQFPLKGDGFELREFTDADASPLADLEFDEDVKCFLSVPTREKSKWLMDYEPALIFGWAVVVDQCPFAGIASLTAAKRRGDVELRIVLSKQYWGQGLGFSVGRLLVKVAFEQHAAKAIVGVVHPENHASIRILRRLGFRCRGSTGESVPQWQAGHYIYRLPRGAYNNSLQA